MNKKKNQIMLSLLAFVAAVIIFFGLTLLFGKLMLDKAKSIEDPLKKLEIIKKYQTMFLIVFLITTIFITFYLFKNELKTPAVVYLIVTLVLYLFFKSIKFN